MIRNPIRRLLEMILTAALLAGMAGCMETGSPHSPPPQGGGYGEPNF